MENPEFSGEKQSNFSILSVKICASVESVSSVSHKFGVIFPLSKFYEQALT